MVDASKQLLPVTLANGPSGQSFEFSYERQKDEKQVSWFIIVTFNTNFKVFMSYINFYIL